MSRINHAPSTLGYYSGQDELTHPRQTGLTGGTNGNLGGTQQDFHALKISKKDAADNKSDYSMILMAVAAGAVAIWLLRR